ncbi:hypothetical protein Q3G72_003302 [Acer saccharum]|nr:hypothetical protein Q3G72_003302 [Acer saccharum]
MLLRYERLQDYCFKCGRLGHVLRECLKVEGERDFKSEDSLRLSVWLRASSPPKKARYGSGRLFVRNRGGQTGRKGSFQAPRDKGLVGCSVSENVCVQPDMECSESLNFNNSGSVLMGPSEVVQVVNIDNKDMEVGLIDGPELLGATGLLHIPCVPDHVLAQD